MYNPAKSQSVWSNLPFWYLNYFCMKASVNKASYYIREICIKDHSFLEYSIKMHLVEKHANNKGQN